MKRHLLTHLSIEEEENTSLLGQGESQSSYDSTAEKDALHTQNQPLVPTSKSSWWQQQRRQKQRKQVEDEMTRFFNTPTKPDINIVGRLLSVFLFLCLGWVAVFTISESHIDWAELLNYEAIHMSKSLQKREGFRTLTYMVVGYMLPGAVSLLCLFVGFKLPFIRSAKMSRLIRVPIPWQTLTVWSLWDLAFIAFFVLVVLIGSFVIRFFHKYSPDWTNQDFWHSVTKISGMSLVNILLIILLPVCKTCFWWDLLGVSFDRILKFHKLLGVLFAVGVFLHGVASVIYLAMEQQILACLWIGSQTCFKPMITYGWASGFLFVPVFVTSLPWFRRHKYEWFYYMHFFVIPGLIFALFHHPSLIYYISPGLTAYILDKMVGFACAARPVQVVSLSVPLPGYTRISLAVSKNHDKFQPGQWIKIKIPAISNWEWHPFSISSAPNNLTISFDIKTMGTNTWTSKLEQLAKSYANYSVSLPHVFLDRYQGCNHSIGDGYLNHSAVLMVAGGIGVTPMMSALRTLVQGGLPKKIRHVKFVWVVKKDSIVDLYRNELARYQMSSNSSKCKLDVLVYVTQSESETTVDPDRRDADSTIETSTHFSTARCKKFLRPAPFSQRMAGHGQHLLLMMAAAIGFMRGMLLGSSMSEAKEWGPRTAVFVQLIAGTLLASILSMLVLGASFLGPPPRRASHTFSHEYDEEDIQDIQNLQVNKGMRPNIAQIVGDMKEYCIQNEIPTVGVSVCGPDALTSAVMDASYAASSHLDVQFILGEESFEW